MDSLKQQKRFHDTLFFIRLKYNYSARLQTKCSISGIFKFYLIFNDLFISVLMLAFRL